MIAKTSKDSYINQLRTGGLSARRSQVLKVLAQYVVSDLETGLTGSEIWEIMKKVYSANCGSASNVLPRLGELKAMGLVKNLEQRKCSITGLMCMTWAPTWAEEFTKPKRKETKDEIIQRLQDRVNELESLLGINNKNLIQ